jgi:hypothetical protein
VTVTEKLLASQKLAESIDREINDLELPATDRARLSAALLDQAHEHHRAIRLLLSNDVVGSAFSLVRILFETTVRSIWLARCATDSELEQFKADTIDKHFGTIIGEVEAFFGFVGGTLFKVKLDYWRAMCSYAHGGYLQAVRRITTEHIRPIYSEDEKMEALRFADFCFMLASIEIFSLANRSDLAEKWCSTFAPRSSRA